MLQRAATIPVRSQVQIFPMQQVNDALLKLKRDEINGTGVLVPEELWLVISDKWVVGSG